MRVFTKGVRLMNNFDLIECQEQARNTSSPRKLFDLWDEVCRRYDRGQIVKTELEEMKGVIWSMLRLLTRLEIEVNGASNRGSPVVNLKNKKAS